jgi:bifunctional isochorismate lyase/aryl carrier protein
LKERYFTDHNLREKSLEISNHFDPTRRARIEWFTPSRSVLFILDMQEYFLQPSSHAFIPSAIAIIPRLQKLIKTYRACSLPIYFTRHINTSQDAGSMAPWWKDLITKTNPLSALTNEFDPADDEILIKTQYDAFYDTPLDELLRSQKVTQVVICGVMTHLCCESTARSAFMRGYDVFFTIDGTATYTEAHHNATLLNLTHGFAVPVLIEEIIAACHKATDENR